MNRKYDWSKNNSKEKIITIDLQEEKLISHRHSRCSKDCIDSAVGCGF